MADGASIAQGAKGKSLAATDDCPYCTRQGLPILPLRLAYPGPDVPKDKILTDSKVGKYVNRILSDGYVYLYDKRATEGWRCFAVTKDGYLREYPVDKRPSGKVTFQCSRAADSLLATTVNIRKPHEAGEVWIAYSSVWWTKKVRSQYERDPSKRMQPINVPQLLGGGLPDGAFKVDPKGQSLVAKVAEYAGQADKFAQSTVLGVDRGKQAADQGKSMDNIMPGKAVAIPLYDAVGMLQEVRRYANAAQGRLADLDTQYTRELWNDQAIQQLKKMFDNAGKSADWSSDYAPKINSGKISQFRNEYNKKRMPLIADRDNICADYVRIVKSNLFKYVRDNDFDHDDGCSCRHFTQQMAEVLNGTGLNLNERQYALNTLQNANDDNLWLRVLLANQKSLLSYVAKDQTSSLNDLGKNLYASIDEWHKTSEKVAKELGLAEGKEVTSKLAEASKAAQDDLYFRWTLTGKEAVENAVQTALANLQTLATDVKLAGLRQIRIALLVGYLWVRVKFAPAVFETTVAQELRRQKMQTWGTDLRGRVASHPIESGKSFSMDVGDVTDELGEAGHVQVRRIVIAWSVTMTMEPGSSQAQIIEVMQQRKWIVQAGSASSSATDTNLSALPKATPALEESNGIAKLLKEGGANALFCGFILYFQAVSFADSLAALSKAKGAADTSNAIAKLASASMAFVGAFVEASFSLLPAVKEQLPKTLVETQLAKSLLKNAPRLAAFGAIMGGVAGILGGFGTYMDGVSAKREGETKTGTYLELGGAVMVAGGLFAIAGGATAYTATGTLLLLGPGGWAVLAIGATVVGVALLFAGEQARSNAYQNWLRKSLFGKDNANASVGYKNESDEAAAFGQLFQLPLKVAFAWRKGMLGGNVDVDISVPALGSGSWINYNIAFTTSDGQVLKGSENRAVGGATPSYSKMVTPALKSYEPPNGAFYTPRADGANWHLDWAFGQGSIEQVSVNLGYWPDKTHDPEIELPSTGGQVFSSTPKDGTKSS